jgi:L-threonylcarbamoyladenylate synthase
MNRLEKAAGHLRIPASVIARQQKYRRILFLSNTDTSRGPMAAELLRNQDLEQEYVIDSRGLVVLFPEPVNQKIEAILKSSQMSLKEYSSVALSDEDLDEDTLILTMDESQKWKIVSEYDNIKNVYTLNEFTEDNTEIPNPYGQPLTAYGECYEIICMLIKKLTNKLNSFTRGGK